MSEGECAHARQNQRGKESNKKIKKIKKEGAGDQVLDRARDGRDQRRVDAVYGF